MKTFQQFLEQIEAAQQQKELAAKKSIANTKASALAGMRHRRHVHGELSHMADYERQHRQEVEKKFNPYA
jgi:anthranilate phosphoribosyltransferase